MLCAVLSHLKLWMQVWTPQHEKNVKLLQSKAMKVVKGLEGMMYEEWLEELGLNKLARDRCIFFLRRNILERKGSLLRKRPNYS